MSLRSCAGLGLAGIRDNIGKALAKPTAGQYHPCRISVHRAFTQGCLAFSQSAIVDQAGVTHPRGDQGPRVGAHFCWRLQGFGIDHGGVFNLRHFTLLEFYTEQMSRIRGVQSVETFVVYKDYNFRVPYIL